jgi:hypothetical protein
MVLFVAHGRLSAAIEWMLKKASGKAQTEVGFVLVRMEASATRIPLAIA